MFTIISDYRVNTRQPGLHKTVLKINVSLNGDFIYALTYQTWRCSHSRKTGHVCRHLPLVSALGRLGQVTISRLRREKGRVVGLVSK